MNLNDVATNNRIALSQQIAAPSNVQNTTEAAIKLTDAALNQLLSELKPGDNIAAQIVSKDGSAVSLLLPNNQLLDAKLSADMGLEVGKLLTFEVRSNGSKLMLSPLFTNTATDPSVNKALNNAGIPVNSDTVVMTKQLMQAGMPVDRASLTDVYKDVINMPDSSIEDIVDLHKLGIPVNESNLEQIDNYKNLSYQLVDGLKDTIEASSALYSEMLEKGDVSSSAKLLDSYLNIALSDLDIESYEASDIAKDIVFIENPDNSINDLPKQDSSLSAADKALQLLKNITAQNNDIDSQAPVRDTKALLLDGLKGFVNIQDSDSKTVQDLLNITKYVFDDAVTKNDTERLGKLLNNDSIRDAIFGEVKEKWSISPSEVSEKEAVKELYNRLSRQLSAVSETFESIGQKDSPAAAATNNMSSNIDFLNQVNQAYAYIQLPLKLSAGNDAHGDLYVYSNGKKLSQKDGKISALLHLDMENLGPLDVYVALDKTGFESKVSTQFYVADDSILDFLNDHMDELTSRLEAKGYSISAKLSVKGDKPLEEGEINASGGGINGVLSQTGAIKLAEYSFDVRT